MYWRFKASNHSRRKWRPLFIVLARAPRQIRDFLRLVNFYHHYVPYCAAIPIPLKAMLTIYKSLTTTRRKHKLTCTNIPPKVRQILRVEIVDAFFKNSYAELTDGTGISAQNAHVIEATVLLEKLANFWCIRKCENVALASEYCSNHEIQTFGPIFYFVLLVIQSCSI